MMLWLDCRKWEDALMQNVRTFPLFPPESIQTDLQTFSKYRAMSAFYNSVFKLRRLDHGKLLCMVTDLWHVSWKIDTYPVFFLCI